MTFALCALAGLLIGSIPTAYFLVKYAHGIDVHVAGSGNVGANNAYRSTGSRRTGLAVMLLDALKGILAVLAGCAIAAAQANTPFALAFWPASVALLGAIAGHNVNPWLSWRAGRIVGGKGLATAAGGFLLVMPWLVPIWGVLFLLGRWAFATWRGVKDSIPGNVVATALVPAAAWTLYDAAGLAVMLVLAVLILPKHRAQMRALLARTSA